jgi:hypothetical protein
MMVGDEVMAVKLVAESMALMKAKNSTSPKWGDINLIFLVFDVNAALVR